MDRSRMVHKNDEIKRRFIQVDLLLLENPKYEGLSDGAILTWAILRNRMELSKQNPEVFSDEEGYLYLIYTDEELAAIIHRNRKTANARKKELEKYGLLYNVRMGNQEANRLYILEPETCDPEQYISTQFRKKKQEELLEKKKEKAKSQKKKYVLLELSEDDEISYPQGESLEALMMSKKGTSLMSKNGTSMKSKNGTSGRVENGHPDVQELGSSYIEGNKTDSSYTDISYTESLNEEEEKIILKEINPYFPSLIKEVLGADGIYDDLMIARIIIEMKNSNISFLTKKEMITQHRKMIQKQGEEEPIWDWAKYFVGGIEKNRLSENHAVTQERLDEAKKFYAYTKKQNSTVPAVPFYNWLEE